jgi:diaminopimelate decarboxylase
VSGGELYRARSRGIPADRIVFSGVGKTITELAAALDAGIYAFNVESEGELRMLSDLAVTMRTRAPIALRVNPDVETPTPHHYTRPATSRRSSGSRTTRRRAVPWRRRCRASASAASTSTSAARSSTSSRTFSPLPHAGARRRDCAPPASSSSSSMWAAASASATTSESGPAPADFADGLVPLLRAVGTARVFEPGRFIVGPAGVLLTRVLYMKRMGGKTFVITDAGMNDLLRPSHYASYHRVEPAERVAGRDVVAVDVVGPICESGDFLALDRPIARPEPGELLAIGTAAPTASPWRRPTTRERDRPK